jgi:hypothetical protein|tara:strand:- start:455 stop:697 length:243 start_codon:yes stop_codon:yes gene_type:complete
MTEFLYGIAASAVFVFVSSLVWDAIVSRIKREVYAAEGEFDRKISDLNNDLYNAIQSEYSSLSQDVRDIHTRIDENCTKK